MDRNSLQLIFALVAVSWAQELVVSQPSYVRGMEGGSITLHCSYNTRSEITIGSYRWEKDPDLELKNTTGEFRGRMNRTSDWDFLLERRADIEIQDLRYNDSGIYRCVVNIHGLQEASGDGTELQVMKAVSWTQPLLVFQSSFTQGTEGGSVILCCTYNSTSDVKVGSYWWVKDPDLEVKNTTWEFMGRVMRTSDQGFLLGRKADIEIWDLRLNDSGRYRCVVNIHDELEASGNGTELQVKKKGLKNGSSEDEDDAVLSWMILLLLRSVLCTVGIGTIALTTCLCYKKINRTEDYHKAMETSSATASVSTIIDLKVEAKCSIDNEDLTEPVTLDCGHNFCKGCITKFCEKWEELGDLQCPLCQAKIQKRSFQINTQLANIVEKIKLLPLEYQCVRHTEKLNLFCKDDKELVCVVCERSPEHRAHNVLLLEMAALEFKEEIKVRLQSLKKEKEKLMEQKRIREQSNMEELTQAEREMQVVSSAFQEMNRFLGEKEPLLVNQLQAVEEEIEKNMNLLSDKIFRLSDLIAEMTAKCQQPANEFLQNIKSTLMNYDDRLRLLRKYEAASVHIPSLVKQRLETYIQKMKDLKCDLETFEASLEQEGNREMVILDPDTAYPSLIFSEDLRTVSRGLMGQNVEMTSKRFRSEPCVLGRDGYTSGRHSWEVEVEEDKQARCSVGVARESVRRSNFVINTFVGIWAVGRRFHSLFSPYHLLAFTSPEATLLTLSHKPKRIRVFLDYKKGLVEFFNAETMELIFSFPSISFLGERLYPFLWADNVRKMSY